MKALKHAALAATMFAAVGINLAHAASPNGAPGQRDPYTDGANAIGARDPYTDGRKVAPDIYTDGAQTTGTRDPYTDGRNR